MSLPADSSTSPAPPVGRPAEGVDPGGEGKVAYALDA